MTKVMSSSGQPDMKQALQEVSQVCLQRLCTSGIFPRKLLASYPGFLIASIMLNHLGYAFRSSCKHQLALPLLIQCLLCAWLTDYLHRRVPDISKPKGKARTILCLPQSVLHRSTMRHTLHTSLTILQASFVPFLQIRHQLRALDFDIMQPQSLPDCLTSFV